MLVPHNTIARGQTHSSGIPSNVIPDIFYVIPAPNNVIPGSTRTKARSALSAHSATRRASEASNLQEYTPTDKVNCAAREGSLGCKVNCAAREGSLGWASNPPEETTNNGIHAPKNPERFHCDYTSQQFVKKADGKHDEFHRVVYRPWGHYDSIDNGERHQVKRITVKPGEKLSVQMHHHRAEHWVVVAGTAKVTRDEETLTLSENESVYLPIGCVHALENPGKIALELIEVQSGSYLGEDDIVRFEDRYGRNVRQK